MKWHIDLQTFLVTVQKCVEPGDFQAHRGQLDLVEPFDRKSFIDALLLGVPISEVLAFLERYQVAKAKVDALARSAGMLWLIDEYDISRFYSSENPDRVDMLKLTQNFKLGFHVKRYR